VQRTERSSGTAGSFTGDHATVHTDHHTNSTILIFGMIRLIMRVYVSLFGAPDLKMAPCASNIGSKWRLTPPKRKKMGPKSAQNGASRLQYRLKMAPRASNIGSKWRLALPISAQNGASRRQKSAQNGALRLKYRLKMAPHTA
jgi:hypothetical protein